MTQDSLQNHDPLFSFCFVVVFFFFFLSRGTVHMYVQDYSEKKGGVEVNIIIISQVECGRVKWRNSLDSTILFYFSQYTISSQASSSEGPGACGITNID